MIREAVLISLLISSVIGKEKAILEIVMHRSTGNGEYTTEIEKIVGHFTSAGSTVSAEGPILQIHPLSICSQEYLTEKMEYGWVGVMKLEIIQAPCMPLFQQAKKAIQRGATAVVFDITDVPEAAIQLKSSLSYQLDRPVIVLRGNQAAKLMRIIRTLENARARIRLDQSKEMETVVNTKEYFDMGIFVAVFVLFCIICIIVVLKLKWRHREQQLSMPELAKRAISKLKTRKYQFPSAKLLRVQTPVSDVYSQSSGLEQCAICLEEYKEGQILRVLPCSHEFHKVCVDPWLVSHGTCPLCLFNIVADQNSCTEEVQPTHRESDLGQSRMYDALSTNPYNVVRAVEHTTYQQSPQPDYLDYLRSDGARSVGRTLVHHVRHMDSARFPRGCPSCEGTMGSSPSSCSSYFGGFHPILSTRGMSVEHTYQNTAEIRCPQTYHQTCCGCSEIRRSHTHRNSHSHHLPSRFTNNPHKIPMCNSGISYSQYLANHSLCRSFHHHGNSFHPHTTTYTHEKFQKFTCNRVKAPGKMWESDPECSGGSVRDSSIAAQYGSCSSDSTCDRNPSNCSLESEYCSQCRIAPIDSAHSTYGSSDVKDVSDSASCDSNVFYSGAPDQMCTDVSSDKTSISENVVQTCSANKCSCHKYRVTENDENACTCTSSNVCDINSRGSNSSTLNLSDVSNFCDSIYSSKETVEVFCRECNSVSPDLSLSNISGITTYVSTEDLFSESSHIIASEHSISLPKNITSVNGSEGILNTQHDGNTDSVQCDPDEHDIHGQSKSAPQCNRTSDLDCSRKVNSCDSHVPLTLSQILKCNYCDGNTSSQTGADNSSALRQGCLQSGSQVVEDKCFQQYPECIRCQTKAVIPRQSMVVYSEPQGAITIPLQTKEVYGPKNAV